MTRVTGHRRRGPPGPPAGHPRRHGPGPHHLRRRRERGRHVRPRDRRAWSASTCPSCRWRTSTRSPDPRRPIPKDLPTMRDPDRLVYFREEVGGLVVGGYERDPDPWCVEGDDPSHLQQHAAAARLGPLPAPDRGGHDARALPGRRRGDAAHQRPGGVHPRRRVHPRRERGGGVLRGGRVLRARHRRSGRQRAGDGRVDRGRRAADGPVEDGHPPLRRPVPQPRLRAGPHLRGVQHLLRHRRTRTTSGRPAGRCGCRRPTRATSASAPSSARRAAGSGSTGTGRTRTASTSTAAAGLGRTALVDRHRHRAPRLPRRGGAVRRVELRQDRGQRGPGRRDVPAAAVRQRRRPSGRARSSTRRCSTPAAASSATSR